MDIPAVLDVLGAADGPCTVAQIKQALENGGADPAQVDASWPRLQRRLRRHPGVIVERNHSALTYRLAEPAHPSVAADPAEAARRRQATIDGLRALAELAAEVEELVADGASGEAIVARVRGRVLRSGLEPVDRAGASTSFDRARHAPIEGGIPDAAPVSVVRPGYVWKSPDGEVLMTRAVVEQE